ncbi:MAG: 2-oxo acid dehydrogenase subunit E2 [Sphingobacteriales bacterium]|nr:MAG: 2-oxo acid dehydrogenase subunit E2 [Sphingobacteriales bacterium]
MAQHEILLPKMGESVAEATIIRWEKNEGDTVAIEDILVEIATDKVDSEVPSPVAGKLIKHFFAENDVARVGDVIAIIETDAETDASHQVNNDAPIVETIPIDTETIETVVPQIEQAIEEVKIFTAYDGGKFYSPLVKSMAQEEGITLQQLDAIIGTGAENRVTKHDLLQFIAANNSANSELPKPIVQQATVTQAPDNGTDEIVEMDRMRKIIADHMVTSLHIAPHVTSFVEADVTNMVKWRDKIKTSFEKREGIKITFTPIFVEAVAKALKDMPMVNVSVNGTQIIKKKNIHIGMATALPSGNLIVPVIKNADQLSLLGITKAVNDLASRARINKLQPDEVQGGTFTLTNLGAFGNIMGTPIINQPQVAILAVGVIQKKPAVLETEFGDVIAIRHKMYLSMSYDHRVVDGSLGGAFIKKVADYLEAWDVNRVV